MTLLFQSGSVMTMEKRACLFSNYNIQYISYLDIEKLDISEYYIPVGSVEFTRKYANHFKITIPTEFSYPECLHRFIHRPLKIDEFQAALNHDFIKPYDNIKLFTGNKKHNIIVEPTTKVWISPYVPFESEFRCYIKNYELIGWSRYDDLQVINPPIDLNYVESIIKEFDRATGICSYSIDIGWRSDIEKWDLIEMNDGWSLGYYNNSDPQSNPPKPQDYTELLVSRWKQLTNCHSNHCT